MEKDRTKRVALLMLPIIIFLLLVSVSYALDFLATITVIPGKPPSITIIQPKNITYGTIHVPLNITASEKFKSIEYSDNGERFRILCRNCQSYYRMRIFMDGQHNLTVCGINNDKKYCDSILFFVDSKEPRITGTSPRRNSYATGTFTVDYMEEYLQNITLYYGKDNMTRNNCTSGRREECVFKVNLSAYEGKEINYRFMVCDSVRCISSKLVPVKVDTIPPNITIIKPKEGEVYVRRVPINISLTEYSHLQFSDNGGRYRTLCSRCNAYHSTRYFSRGLHNITFMTVDEAGNEKYGNVTFYVQYESLIDSLSEPFLSILD